VNIWTAQENRFSPSFTLTGVLIATLLQLVLAPNIAINEAVPNFCLVFVVLNAMRGKRTNAAVTGFVLGLIYDLLSQGPLGVMSLILTIVGYSVASFDKQVFATSWPIQLLLLLAAAFLGELLYATMLTVVGYSSNFYASFMLRALPGSLYDAVFGLIVFPLIYRASERQDAHKLKNRLGSKGKAKRK